MYHKFIDSAIDGLDAKGNGAPIVSVSFPSEFVQSYDKCVQNDKPAKQISSDVLSFHWQALEHLLMIFNEYVNI